MIKISSTPLVLQVIQNTIHHEKDRLWKWYLSIAAMAHIRFILSRDNLHKALLAQGVSIVTYDPLDTVFSLSDTVADMLFLVTLSNGFRFYLPLEIQSTYSTWMKHRSAAYAMEVIQKYQHVYGNLPIFPVVLFLFDDAKTVGAGLFEYKDCFHRQKVYCDPLFICLKSISRSEIEALRDPLLWPMMVLTGEKLDDIIITTMFADLQEKNLREIAQVAFAAASWSLEKRGQFDDLAWLRREYAMEDMLLSCPPVREALEKALAIQAAEQAAEAQQREKEWAKRVRKREKELAQQAQKREEKLTKQAQKAEADRQKAEVDRQKAEADRQKAEVDKIALLEQVEQTRIALLEQVEQVEQARIALQKEAAKEKELLATFRQMIVDTVDLRFSSLVPLAKKMVKTTENYHELRQAQRQLMVASDIASAKELLDALGDEDNLA